MSFRARSRTTQPLPSRHRSLSSSRVQNAGSTYSNYNGTTYNSSNLRPLSTGSGYYQNNSGKSSSTSGGNGSTSSYLYQSPYTSSNIYNSRDNLYSISATRNGGGSVGGSYNNAYSNGKSITSYRLDYNKSNSNNNKSSSSNNHKAIRQKRQQNKTTMHQQNQPYQLHQHQHHSITVAFAPSSNATSKCNTFSTSNGASLISKSNALIADSYSSRPIYKSNDQSNKSNKDIITHPTIMFNKLKNPLKTLKTYLQIPCHNIRTSLTSFTISTTSTPITTNIITNVSNTFSKSLSSCRSASAKSPSSYHAKSSNNNNSAAAINYKNLDHGKSNVSISFITVTNNDHRYDHRSYTSPYVSSYDHGITTASLSFNMGPTTKNVGSSNITTNCSTPSSTLAKSNSFRGSNSYLNTTNNNNNNAISMANARSLHKAKSLSQSSSSLNMYHMGTGSMGVASATAIAAITSRSNSLREQERKSRTRSRSRSAAQRSLSASSEKSEGYESGSEQKHSTRSRLETTSSSTAASSTTATSSTSSTSTSSATYDKKSREKTDNDDNIDYKALWEAVKLENEKLKQQLKKKDDEITQTRTTLERFANTNAKSSLSENEKRERRAMERKLSELEEELKQLQKLKSENERLRAENRALTRVVSKLTTSAQCQLSKSKQ